MSRLRRRLAAPVLLLLLCTAVSGLDGGESRRTGEEPRPAEAEGGSLLFADRLYAEGAFEAAITEYKRHLFLYTDQTSASEIYRRIAFALRALERWEESTAALRRSILCARSDDQRRRREIDLLATMIAAGKFDGAEFQAARLRASAGGPSDDAELAYYEIVLYALMHRWDDAAGALARLRASGSFGGGAEEAWDAVEVLLSEAREAKRKSPGLALWLSTFLPGAGQMYAGDVKSGLNAFAVNSASVALMAAALLKQRYLESALVFLYLVKRFYHGNRFNAERQAVMYNRRVDDEYARRTLEAMAALPVD